MADVLSPTTEDHHRFESESVPSEVRNFVSHFYSKLKHDSLKSADVLLGSYENNFMTLSDKFYKNSAWPSAEAVAHILGISDDKEPFLFLYKEMAYRHIYTRMQPTLQHRFESFYNYINFFNVIIESETLDFDLPNKWLWDVLDEFVYQYQAFSQYRARVKGKSVEEIEFLKAHSDVWNARTVMQYLESLIQRSDIIDILESEKQGQTSVSSLDMVKNEPQNHVYRMLGYFSMVALLRVNCLLGDYYLALKAIEPIDLSKKKSLFSIVTSCHTSFVYYVAFSYMMLRRYTDAIRTITSFLAQAARSKQSSSAYQSDFTDKKKEQIFALLAIVLALCPSRLEENIHTSLRDKYNEKITRMQRGEELAFEELFSYACPKFISPAFPSSSAASSGDDEQQHQPSAGGSSSDAFRHQLRLFLKEVRQQQHLITIRSYLKLYTAIPISKLAKFLDFTATGGDTSAEANIAAFRQQLLSLKHKTRQLVWTTGESALTGKWASSSDVDFFIDGDIVHIADFQSAAGGAPSTSASSAAAAASVSSKRYANQFVSKMAKINDVIKELQKSAPAA